MSDDLPFTLAQRLNADAQRLAAAHQPRIGWLAQLRPVLHRATTGPNGRRFERVEQLPKAPVVVPPAPPLAPGQPLSLDLQDRVQAVSGAPADMVRVHEGDLADKLARRHRADAVTFGRDVYFRDGRFRPQDNDGLALLTHEAVHVAFSSEPGPAGRRASPAGGAEEEAAALAAEAVAKERGHTGAALAAPRATRPQALPPQPGATPDRPQAAAVDRDWQASTTRAPSDLATLRHDAQRELLAQIRLEFERGA